MSRKKKLSRRFRKFLNAQIDSGSGRQAGRQARQASHPRGLFRVIKSTELFSELSGLNLKRGRETERKRERENERRKGGRRAERTAAGRRRWRQMDENEEVRTRSGGRRRRGEEVEAVIKRVSCRSPN